MADATKADTQSGNTGKEAQGEQSGKKADPSLDELLAAYGKEPKPETKKEPEKAADKPADTAKAERDLEARIAARVRAEDRAERDFDKLVGEIANDDGAFDKDDARAYLTGLFEDPRMLTAFAQRYHKPAEWGQVVEKLKDKAAKIVERVTSKHNLKGRDSVRAAARTSTAGTSQSSKVNFKSMSDADFDKWKRDNLRP